MSAESIISGLAKASAAVTALVPAASIWTSEAPQGQAAPFVVFTRISTVPQNTMDEGATGTRAQLDNVQVQAAVYGTSTAQSLAIAAAIRRAITNEATLRALCTSQDESYEEDPRLRGQILSFSCWVAEDLA